MVLTIVSWTLLAIGIIALLVRRKTRHAEAVGYVGIICTALGAVCAAVFTSIALTGEYGIRSTRCENGIYIGGTRYIGENRPWAGKNVLVIGDSVSDLTLHSHPWQETFASALGCTVMTHARGGATLLDMIDGGEVPGGTMPALTQQDVSGKDLIILFGGGNDVVQGTPNGQVGDMTTGTLCGNLFHAVYNIYELLAAADNLTCRVMVVGYYNVGRELSDERAYQTIEDTVNWLGLPYIDLRKISGINPVTWSIYGQEDEAHLTTAGNDLIGDQIAKFVENTISPVELRQN